MAHFSLGNHQVNIMSKRKKANPNPPSDRDMFSDWDSEEDISKESESEYCVSESEESSVVQDGSSDGESKKVR